MRLLPPGKGSHLLEDLARAIDLSKPGRHHEGRVLQVVLDIGIGPPLVQQLLNARCLTPERWVGGARGETRRRQFVMRTRLAPSLGASFVRKKPNKWDHHGRLASQR